MSGTVGTWVLAEGQSPPKTATPAGFWQRHGGVVSSHPTRAEAEAALAAAGVPAIGPACEVQEVEQVSRLIDFAALRPELEARRENPAIAAILRCADEDWQGSLEAAWSDAEEGSLGADAYHLVEVLDGQLRKEVRSPSTWQVWQPPYWVVVSACSSGPDVDWGWEGLHGE